MVVILGQEMTWQRGVITEFACPSEIEKRGAQFTLSVNLRTECNGQRPGGLFKMSGMKATVHVVGR